MTEIYFYSDAIDKLQVTCKLCVKAVGQGARLIVYTQDKQMLEKLDMLLWTFQQTSFLPHCFINDETAIVRGTPVVLSDRVVRDQGYTMLLNLHGECPADLESFQRVIEIASQSPDDKASARTRYRNYQQAGYTVQHYKLDNR